MLPADPKAGAPGDGSSSQGSKAGVRGDEAFLIHFDREVELLEDFTNARDKLDREIDTMGPTSQEKNNPEGPEPLEMTEGDTGNREAAAAELSFTMLFIWQRMN